MRALKLTMLAVSIISLFLAGRAQCFTISPARYFVTVDPGQKTFVEVSIKNDDLGEQKFSTEILGAKQDERGRLVFGTGYDEAENWVMAEHTAISVSEKDTTTVKFYIAVPTGAKPTSHYVGLAVRSADGSNNMLSFSARLVAVLGIQVAGEAREGLDIKKWSPLSPAYVGKVWSFDLSSVNSGNIDIPLKGEIKILDWRGNVLLTQPVEMGSLLFAGAERRLASLAVDLAAANSKDILWPGPYQAKIGITYGHASREAVALANVWYLPLWAVISVLLIMILLSFFGTLLRNRNHK